MIQHICSDICLIMTRELNRESTKEKKTYLCEKLFQIESLYTILGHKINSGFKC